MILFLKSINSTPFLGIFVILANSSKVFVYL
jgi:hypothetical protein